MKQIVSQTLLKNSIFSIFVRVANALLLFGVGVLLARALGPVEYGTYAIVMSIVMVASIPVTAGMPNLFVREISKAKAKNFWEKISRLFHWYFKTISIYSLSLFALFLAANYLLIGGINGNLLHSLGYGVWLVPLLSLVLTLGAAMRGTGSVILGQIPNSIIVPALFLLCLFPFLTAGDLTAAAAIQLKLVAIFIAFCISAFLLYKRLKGKVSKAAHRIHKIQLASLISLTLIGGFQILLENIDTLVLGLLCTRQEVGTYRVSVQLANLVVFGLYSINQILHPRFAKLYAQGKLEKLRALVSTSSKIILITAIPPVLLFVAAGGMLLSLLFGEAYATGSMVLRVLAVGQLINASFGSVGALLNMTGNEKDTLKGMIVAVVLNLILNFLLVPLYGPEGAAWATVISCFAWNVILRSSVAHRLGIESCGWLSQPGFRTQ